MTKSHILLTSLISFCTGIGIHTYLPYQPSFFTFAALGTFGLIIIILILKSLKIRIFLKLLTILTSLLLGISRGQSTIHIPTPDTIDYYTQESPSSPYSQPAQLLEAGGSSQPITIIGTIAEEPDARRDKINYTIEVRSMVTSNQAPETRQPISGYTLISSNKYPQYQFGDTLEITGNLQKPAVFDSFDYAGYLSRFDIYSVMYRPKIQLMNERTNERKDPFISSSVHTFMSSLLNIKSSFEHHLNLTYPTEPTSSFMAGLLLGSRKGMPEQLTLDFQTTGLTHIVAISGYNITLIVSILMAIFKPFGRRTSILLSALGIMVFTLFVGASPAVVRACIMGLIALVALNSERKGNISIILALTASIMIGYNPKILIHDVGFQLSFLATMGLVYVSPILEPYLQWLPKKLAIRDSINLSLSAQIMALPIIVLNFHNLSLISPISNLLVAGPIIPFSMLFGFVGTMTSYISLPLAKIIAYPGYILLRYIVHVIEVTADIPYAAIQISWFSKSMLALYFIGLSGILLWWWQEEQRRHMKIHQLQLFFEHRVVEELWLKNPML